ncbi:prepilin peptidase [Chitinasiproducens palmae]|uniref:Prepilin leader peptidase/N-methyltransferase n=1 Tax=Chitinasiproducens palmae TaxID=1770053 RepID=A0A1H2PRM2_9BURK|nr:leader peptidase (prepilin peptidase) / N-methyltransferase [Chitinasiproducens palmae]
MPYSVTQTASWGTPLMGLPPAFVYCMAALLGLVIGSFLNVVIHRLPTMLEADESDAMEPAVTTGLRDEVEPTYRAGMRDPAQAGSHDREETNNAGGHDGGLPGTALPTARCTASRTAPATDRPAQSPDRSQSDTERPSADGRHVRYDLCYPPSSCPHCGHRLRVYENIPVLSYLVLRGRCAACASRISPVYPCVEIAAALLAVWCASRFGVSVPAFAGFALGCVLLALAMIDVRHYLLPDSLTLPLLWAGLLVNTRAAFTDLTSAVIGAAAGYVSLWLVYWLFLLLRKKEGLGYGDFKMLAAIGAWFGWQCLPLVTLVAAVTGSIFGITLAVAGKRSRDAPIPFGTFLAVGAACQLFGWLPGFP